MVIDGGLGSGKSALLREISRRANTSVATLAARCAPDEADQGFATIRQLLEPLAGTACANQPDGDDLAWLKDLDRGWFDQVTTAGSNGDLRALYWFTVQIAVRKPLCLLVDDAQWADERSVAFLAYLLRRLHQISVLLVVSLDEQEPSPRWPLLAHLARDPSAILWHLRPLGPDSVATLCKELLDETDETIVAACHELTGGVPYLVRELLTEVTRLPANPEEPLVERLLRCGSPTVAAVALGRARRHGEYLGEVLSGLCVANTPLPEHCLSHVVDGAEAEIADAVDTLRRLSLLTVAEGTSTGVDGSNCAGVVVSPPLVRQAIYHALTPSARHLAETRIARALVADGGQTEAAALHLLETFPNGEDEHVRILRAAATAAVARGHTENASAFLRRALREPPPEHAIGAVLAQLGAVESRDDGPSAVRHLRAALTQVTDPAAHASTALRLAHALVLSVRTEHAVIVLEDELRHTRLPGDHHLVQRIRAELLFVSLGDDALHQRILGQHGLPSAGCLAGEDSVDRDHQRTVLAARALHDALGGQPSGPVLDRVSSALNGRLMPGDNSSIGLLISGLVLIWGDELAAADRFFQDAYAESAEHGSVLCASLSAWMRGLVAVRRGQLPTAQHLIAQAHQLVTPSRWDRWRLAPMIAAAELAIECGTGAELLENLASTGFCGDFPRLMLAHVGLARRGRLRAIQGDVRRGLDDLREAGRRLEAMGWVNPAVVAWRSDAAMALRQLNQGDEARRLVEQEIGLATEWGSPRPIAIALRRRGLLAPRGKGQDDLVESLRLLDGCDLPLERARSLLALGRSQRGQRNLPRARATLTEARTIALTCGAPGLLGRIDEELVAAGGRPPLRSPADASTPLTAGEDRVARLAAAGRTNDQIARELFVTRRTIEVHLTSVYRKLRIHGRSGLPAALEALIAAPPALLRL